MDRLLVNLLNVIRIAWGRKRQHGHVAIEPFDDFRLLATHRRIAAALQVRAHWRPVSAIDCSGLTQGPPLPVHPGLAGMVITSPSLAASWLACLNSSPPRAAHELHRPFGDADIDLHEQHATHTGALDRFKIGRDPLAAEIAIHDKPVGPGTSGIGEDGGIFEPIRRRSQELQWQQQTVISPTAISVGQAPPYIVGSLGQHLPVMSQCLFDPFSDQLHRVKAESRGAFVLAGQHEEYGVVTFKHVQCRQRQIVAHCALLLGI